MYLYTIIYVSLSLLKLLFSDKDYKNVK